MVINSSVTSLARIYLDQSLRLLQANGCSLIYSDTDSVVFRCKKGVDPGLKVHPSIFGSFKNEVAEGQRIKLFVTMGAKNYSYE